MGNMHDDYDGKHLYDVNIDEVLEMRRKDTEELAIHVYLTSDDEYSQLNCSMMNNLKSRMWMHLISWMLTK